MPRKMPPPPEFGPAGARASLVWRIGLSLATPMLGGGHRTKEIDEVTPISGKAVRGQLRFWWRYMCGSQLESANSLPQTELMRLREAEVFGGQDVRSPFDIVIENVGPLRRSPNKGGNGPDEGYVFFPLRDAPTDVVAAGLSFTLVVRWLDQKSFDGRCQWESERRKSDNRERHSDGQLPMPFELPQIRSQFNEALWAWLSFGGIGSRTRRGLGSLLIDAKSSGHYSFETTRPRKARYERYPEIYCSPRPFDDAPTAWLAAVSAYREFRQSARGQQHFKTWLKMDGPLLKRASGDVQGRSKWPEPDSIRIASGCALAPGTLYLDQGVVSSTPTAEAIEFNDHTMPVATGGQLPAYPRAALGLPIVFHFADGPKIGKYKTYAKTVGIPASQRDPDEATLVPMVMKADGALVAGNRMASPIITKAIRLQDGWHAAVIILRPPELHGLRAQLNTSAGPTPVEADQIAGPDVSGFVPMRGKSNALDALVAFLLTQRFKRYGAEQ